MISEEQEARIQSMYLKVDEEIREDIGLAYSWAKEQLRDLEGSGHLIYVHGHESKVGLVVCSFSKPSWAGDHCSRGMNTGSEAIVMAVCEYLNGA